MDQKIISIRLKFIKGNEVKYISHLDLMRTFQRALRRSELPVSYSSGFNPHQEISFGAPLSLGVTSEAEYVDIRFSESIDIKEIVERLNSKLPAGIKILSGVVLSDKAKSAMGIVSHSSYKICMYASKVEYSSFKEKFKEFLAQDQILAMKKQPKKDFELKEIDIKPMIIKAETEAAKDSLYCINCMLLSGSKANLKPELLITAFKEYSKYKISRVHIHREEVYAEKEGQLLELLQYASSESL